jgi:hypothetical protein
MQLLVSGKSVHSRKLSDHAQLSEPRVRLPSISFREQREPRY